MARPAKKLTKEQTAEVETLASLMLTAEQIADYFGISRATFFNLLNRDEHVHRLYKKGRARSIALASSKLRDKIMKDDAASIFFFLKTQAGWKETAVIESKEQQDLKVKIIKDRRGD